MNDRQEGGKLIGQGVFGCAFDPPLNCIVKKKQDKHQVGKVTFKEFADIEYTISKQIEKIPYAKDYFSLIENYCVPKQRKQQVEKDISDCNALKTIPLTKTIQLVQPYGGKVLYEVPKNYKNIHFFSLVQHLLETGAILLAGRLVHSDLHVWNILVDRPYSTKIIDFGISWSPDSLTLSNLHKLTTREFDVRYRQSSPELLYSNGKTEKISAHLVYAKFYDNMKILKQVETIYDISVENQVKRFRSFVEMSKTLQDENWLGFFKLYWHKQDAWSIGVVLIELYLELIYSDKEFESVLDSNPELMKKMDLLKFLVDMDAGKRYDCAEVLRLWNPESKILQIPQIKKWLVEQDKIRRSL